MKYCCKKSFNPNHPTNQTKNQDPSYKMDLDFGIGLKGLKPCFIMEEIMYTVIFLIQILCFTKYGINPMEACTNKAGDKIRICKI